MTELTELQKAERDVATAEGAVRKAQVALDAERTRVARARDDRAEIEARLLAADPGDPKLLASLDSKRQALDVAVEVLERARVPRAEAALAEGEASLQEACKARDRAQRDELHARFDAEEEEIARVAQEAEGRLRELLLQHQATGGTIVDLTHQAPRGRFLAAAGHAGYGGDRGKMWLALVAPLNDLEAVSREAAHLRWLDEVRRSRGLPTAREAEDARVRQFVNDLGERERATAERRARRERGEIPAEPPLPPPPPPPRSEPSWADKSRRED